MPPKNAGRGGRGGGRGGAAPRTPLRAFHIDPRTRQLAAYKLTVARAMPWGDFADLVARTHALFLEGKGGTCMILQNPKTPYPILFGFVDDEAQTIVHAASFDLDDLGPQPVQQIKTGFTKDGAWTEYKHIEVCVRAVARGEEPCEPTLFGETVRLLQEMAEHTLLHSYSEYFGALKKTDVGAKKAKLAEVGAEDFGDFVVAPSKLNSEIADLDAKTFNGDKNFFYVTQYYSTKDEKMMPLIPRVPVRVSIVKRTDEGAAEGGAAGSSSAARAPVAAGEASGTLHMYEVSPEGARTLSCRTQNRDEASAVINEKHSGQSCDIILTSLKFVARDTNLGFSVIAVCYDDAFLMFRKKKTVDPEALLDKLGYLTAAEDGAAGDASDANPVAELADQLASADIADEDGDEDGDEEDGFELDS